MEVLTRFDSLIGQDNPARILKAIISSGQYPNALLFVGRRGLGKKSAARIFAMAANCTGGPPTGENACTAGEPCGNCISCRKIVSGTHPDFHTIGSGREMMIKIDEIRTLQDRLSLRPHEAALRVVLIPDAGRLNPEAGNALLKILEEPPHRTIFIMTVARSLDLLPTIISRCHRIDFLPVPAESVSAVLQKKFHIQHPTAGIIASLSGGSIGLALEMAKKDLDFLVSGVIKLLPGMIDDPIGIGIPLSEYIGADKELMIIFFSLLKILFRDMAVAISASDWLMLPEYKTHIMEAAKKTGLTIAVAAAQDASDVESYVMYTNANPRIAAEAFFLRLYTRLAKKKHQTL